MTRLGMGLPLGLVLLFAVTLSTGCVTTLEGRWDGEIDCGSWGEVDLELDIEAGQNNTYTGEGEISGFYYDSSPAVMVFDVEVRKTKLAGAQPLDIEPDDCEVEIAGLGTYDEDCEEPEDSEWDGENTITGEIEDFLGISGNDCDFEVER